jgi:hypothetical protein
LLSERLTRIEFMADARHPARPSLVVLHGTALAIALLVYLSPIFGVGFDTSSSLVAQVVVRGIATLAAISLFTGGVVMFLDGEKESICLAVSVVTAFLLLILTL